MFELLAQFEQATIKDASEQLELPKYSMVPFPFRPIRNIISISKVRPGMKMTIH